MLPGFGARVFCTIRAVKSWREFVRRVLPRLLGERDARRREVVEDELAVVVVVVELPER